MLGLLLLFFFCSVLNLWLYWWVCTMKKATRRVRPDSATWGAKDWIGNARWETRVGGAVPVADVIRRQGGQSTVQSVLYFLEATANRDTVRRGPKGA